jgi:hypothetical protein
MHLESLESHGHTEEEAVSKSLEISVGSEKDLGELMDWLKPIVGDEGAEQFVFALRTMIGEDYVNHCKDATQEFGKRLATRFGDEESFFDLVPSAEFSDVRSYAPLNKVGSRADYHSVAMIDLQKEHGPMSVIIDLTYSTVSSDSEQSTALLLQSEGNDEEAMAALQEKYGGAWKVDFKLDTETGTFVFQE